MSATKSNLWVAPAIPEIHPEDLEFFRSAIKDRAGISMKPTKHELMQTRLRDRLIANGLSEFAEYRQLLESLPDNDPEWQEFTNLLTTNKTDFFREPKHFEFLVQQILPAWLKTSEKIFSIWSAASSTGEEPYTLAMVLSQHLPKDRDFQILATDIDTKVLKRASNAVYSMSKIHEIPREYHQHGIDLGQESAQGWFRIKPLLRSKVRFQQHNLMSPQLPDEKSFDLVLCRNVLIYFDRDGIDRVQAKLHDATKPSGHLFIGHSESLQGIDHPWKSAGPSVLKKS